MMRIKSFLYCLLLFLIFFTACSNKNEIKDYKKFASIYVDVLIAEEKNKGNFELFINERNKIFEKYSITSDQYKNTILYYNQSQEKWGEFFAEVNKRILDLKKNRNRKTS